ncbi:hypothetical protein TIFTF001_039419 [Ficus carica]|uniref:Uncharacterized protein n=1 Tax=Ficus carica TaxID=3494 RepID=A0AA88ECB6_FICCA|nr:hypothetical protein TIFTF001_039414 [Ficus carica]GMN70375.1 hypothetical protein TIFTF001_039419 [Ficus carica]
MGSGQRGDGVWSALEVDSNMGGRERARACRGNGGRVWVGGLKRWGGEGGGGGGAWHQGGEGLFGWSITGIGREVADVGKGRGDLRIVIIGVEIVSFQPDLLQVVIARIGITSFCCIHFQNLSLLDHDLDKSRHFSQVVVGIQCLVGLL